MPFPFLTARWSNLCLFTYAVAPSLLEDLMPAGLELDRRDGQAFVSLVAFDFLETRVLGIPWPGYRHFAELNLRLYVRRGAERGVVFVREFVPQRLVAWLARVVYNEHYVAAPLSSTIRDEPTRRTVEHRLIWQGHKWTLSITGSKPALRPAETGVEHFFKEHRWGYCTSHRGHTLRYEVQHPVWQIFPVTAYRLDLDWAQVYGPRWQVLQGQEPYSVVLAEGSSVAVFPRGKLALDP